MTKPVFKTTPDLKGKEAENFVKMAEENARKAEEKRNKDRDSGLVGRGVMNDFSCTECSGDATVGMSRWVDCKSDKEWIKKGERLCMKCFKKRTGSIFTFHS